MFGKVLLTLLVIGLAYAVIRARMRKEAGGRPGSRSSPAISGMARQFAWTFLAVLLLSSALLGYWRWRQGERVVAVRVINTNTGRTQVYHAHEADLGERRFVTLDGRRVVLAEVERMEVREERGAPAGAGH